MVRRLLTAAIAVFLSTTAHADELEIDLHNQAMRINYTQEMYTVGKGVELEIGHFFNEVGSTATHAGMHVSGENWSKQGTFDIGLGARALWITAAPGDMTALALGGRVRFSPAHRVGFTSYAYYAPDIITFISGRRYFEMGLQADYQLLPQGFVYAGLRHYSAIFDAGSARMDDGYLHLGMRLVF